MKSSPPLSRACLSLAACIAWQASPALGLLVHSDQSVRAHEEVALVKAESSLASAVTDALLAEPGDHPWWQLDWTMLVEQPQRVLLCSVVLLASGVLCAAGGIGGGGIYVSLLMIAGGLSAHDAVPLSKAIVFQGALVTLVQNMHKRESSGQSMIDFNACSLIVPSALSGTLLGVFINRLVVEWNIVLLIIIVLLVMSAVLGREVYKQFMQSHDEAVPEASATEACCEAGGSSRDSSTNSRLEGSRSGSQAPSCAPRDFCDGRKTRKELLTQEVVVSMSLLIIVVLCGAMHYRMSECQRSLRVSPLDLQGTCTHPLLNLMFSRSVYAWMNNKAWAGFALVATLAVPLCLCLCASTWCCFQCVRFHQWSSRDVLLCCATAVCTGLLAGLVGIGGGLIISPFLLLTGMPPNVAVATSSTCVLFTSCSTAMQYLLSDRVVISLCLVYGSINMLASYLGTWYVHYLQDKSTTGRWRISATVLAGVVISVLFCLAKFRMLILQEGRQAISQ
mmetsp:Transcript_62550/g.116305  ORF Transcript_62550/g.116305 Transcript_62550/m.116305 type:complete len:506 (-) Transcript_62550:68-1585(-)